MVGSWGWQFSDGNFCRIILGPVYVLDIGPKEETNSVVFVRKRPLCSVNIHDGPTLLHSTVLYFVIMLIWLYINILKFSTFFYLKLDEMILLVQVISYVYNLNYDVYSRPILFHEL